ncbi:sodium channel protein Nach-like [Agrilus planipennis]|uniref:Sodium channel protein Nach-like n=1 Tax=Agrilus planipennis TaxID=224129 RepID=A0A1W4X5K5_AGRPL|nr:sodium channel protein Nach-like [Agrilus planipennis]
MAGDSNKKEKPLKITDFSSDYTTVHGVNHIFNFKTLLIERVCWVLAVSFCFYGLCVIGLSNIRRFRENPTVISIEKDYRNWHNPFPAMTGCFVDKLDEELAESVIQEIWNITYSSPKYEYYWKFLESVANLNYYTLKSLESFENDTELNDIDVLDIALRIHPEFHGKFATSHSRKATWKLTMSELENNENKEDLFTCHILNGLCYARFDSDPSRPIQYFAHSYLDIPHISMDPPILLDESGEIEINYRMQETTADSATRSFTPTQRGCRFDDEPPDKIMPAYSASFCYVHCRYKKALEHCKCKPLFYHYMNEGKECDIKGLICLSKLDFWKKPPTAIGCQCPQACDIVAYIPQVPKKTVWKTGYFDQRITFRWGLIFPTTKYRREVIFGIDKLVAAIGGTGGLFLGVSFVTLVEIVFIISKIFMTWWKEWREEMGFALIGGEKVGAKWIQLVN